MKATAISADRGVRRTDSVGVREALVLIASAVVCTSATGAQSTPAPVPASFPPLQLEMRVPFEPTAFPSAGRTYLTYELHLRNFAPSPLALRRLEVLDGDPKAGEPLATYEGPQLDSLVQAIGVRVPNDAGGESRQVAGGGSVVMFLLITFERGARVPDALRHRVFTSDSALVGPRITTRHTELRVFGPPLNGPDWLARSGPSNDSYHRRGILVIDGVATIDRRYAIDWVRSMAGATFAGDALDNRSYHAYDQEVLSVADGTVISAHDGIAENVPRRQGFRPAVAISMDTLAGNTITVDVGGGQFAYYMHLKPNSLRVKAGDRVRRGQVLASIGNSGDSREPHLHFEVTTSPRLLAGEGLPYLIERYRALSDGAWQTRTRELPLRDMVIDFGSRGGDQ